MHRERFDALISQHFRLLVCRKHEWDVRAVHVGVQQSHLVAHLAEGERQVDGQRRLSYPAFSGTDSDDSVNTRKRLRGGRLLARMMTMSTQGIPSQKQPE